MATLTLNYGSIESAYKAMNDAAQTCTDRADDIKTKITQKFGALEMGSNGNTSSAESYLNKKMAELNKKHDVYDSYSKRLDDFLNGPTGAKEVDKKVAASIKTQAVQYREMHNMKTNIADGLFAWLSSTWNSSTFGKWLNGAFTDIGNWVAGAWNDVVAFYKEHKKIIDTILIVVGAVLAIGAIILTGGAALVPLLTALGMSAGLATGISMGVAAIAGLSMLASSTLNVIDTWAEIDNPTFNAWQNGLNIVSGVTNLLYSVGSIYSSVKGISNSALRDYGKQWITNSTFRDAVAGANKFSYTLRPNTSYFWSAVGDNDMGWYNGDLVAGNIAERMGGTTLETTLKSNGINMPAWLSPEGPATWNSASASYALRSSGNVNALLGQGVRSTSTWNTVERLILNINPNVTSITQYTLSGVSVFSRGFQASTFLSGLMPAGSLINNAMINSD